MQRIKTTPQHHAASPSVKTVYGQDTLIDARQVLDSLVYDTHRGERLRYKIGVRLVHDGLDRLYLPAAV